MLCNETKIGETISPLGEMNIGETISSLGEMNIGETISHFFIIIKKGRQCKAGRE